MVQATYHKVLVVLGVGLFAGVVGKAWADDRPLERSELDRRIVTIVYETALLGTEIYNKGNHEGCYRLYQGALMALESVLDHRPRLQQMIREKMTLASRLKPDEGAHVLREALDEIQNTIAPSSRPPDIKLPALWFRLGGETAIKAIVDDFFDACLKEPKINFSRGGKYKMDAAEIARQKRLLLELFSLLTGGPLEYSGKRNLKEAHAGMQITDAEFDAMVATLRQTLAKYKVDKRDADELIKLFEATRPVIVEVKRSSKD
ncbi:MAG: group 1 truncated hemoglobin [Gemmataceae bacterium]|nr:group 1 truncated hemoglobin [Gemmataceae bacterium]MCS7270887.1 group 1 truncated hemoglobin [Gemmataceae bacterium]MDW8242015.1 group 1 truncated hemoglobin [Thermogemmata sp.]